MKKVLNIREPNVYTRHLEAEVIHPLISVIHFDELEKGMRPLQVSEWSVVAGLLHLIKIN
jgi:hypothetical protein